MLSAGRSGGGVSKPAAAGPSTHCALAASFQSTQPLRRGRLLPAARVTGATLMWGISGKLRKKYGVEGDVRQELYKASTQFGGVGGGLLNPTTVKGAAGC